MGAGNGHLGAGSGTLGFLVARRSGTVFLGYLASLALVSPLSLHLFRVG